MTLSDQSTLDLRPFPMQDGPPIPWFLAEVIYRHLYGTGGQTLERLGERGGFGWAEVEYMWKQGTPTARERTKRYADAAFSRAFEQPQAGKEGR